MLDLQQVQSQPQLAHIMLPNGQLQQVQIMAAAAPGLSAQAGSGFPRTTSR